MSADVAQPPSPPRILGSRASSEHQHHQRQQSSGSSSLRLTDDTASDKHQQKSPQSSSSLTSSYLRHGRRRSDGTETGSIGYGSSAPLESETSYSSHPGYPASKHGQAKSPPSSTDLPLIQQPQLHHHSRHQNQPLGSPSSSASQSSSSTPSSGAYVDVSSSARLAGPVSSSSVSPPTTTAVPSGAHHRTGSRRPKNALIKTRTTVPVLGPSTSAWAANNNANINNNINNNNVINNNNNNNNINNNINNNNNVNNNGPSASSAESESGFVVDAEKGNAYYKGQLLGKGGFARVYLITDIVTKKQYACKIIPKHQMQKIHMQKIAREIMIHKELNHVNVVQMHHYFEDTLNVYMLLEACPKKSLVHVLKYRGKVTEPEARYYMKQMVTGVAYIHSQKIIHRDLKPGNMFLSEKMIVKIGDFGLATQPDGQRRRVTICGTPNFIAPEVLFKQSYSYEADVWALGCILYVLLVGQPPFDSSTLKETYARICGHRYKELDDATATRAGQDLVRWLLQPNPELRPPLELVKEHPYLTREYVPASLPDSCCYQAPRLPFDERIQPPPPLLGQSDFDQLAKRYDNGQFQDGKKSKSALQGSASAATSTSTTTAAGGGGPASAPSTGSAAVNKKKKKVSSWLASWRLPRLPRFRQRISSVLCLEARRKQAALAAAAGSTTPTEGCCLAADAGLPTSQITLMSRALEDCLTAGSARARTRTTAPPLVDHHAPLFVTKWIDYSNKYGLTFQLSDRSVGVLFNDSTKMSYTHDRRRVEYMTADDEVTKYNRERNVPAHLQEKLQLLRHFTDYMDKHLTEGGEVSMHRSEASQSVHGPRRSSRGPTSLPLMRRWLRTSKAIVMELSVPLLQMNFFEDHTKLIVSREPGPQPGRSSGAAAAANASSVEPSATERYLVTYIDGERRASTYWLDDLRDLGCGAELHERLLYVYKVAKEFAELDAAAAAQAR